MSQHEHSSSSTAHGPEPRSMSLAFKYFCRAMQLKCPECGQYPIFPPALRVRRLSDWFTPLDGCPRCGYPYEREIGYFLMAIWAVGYGLASLIGISFYLFFEYVEHFSFVTILVITLPVVLILNLLFARHSKSLWLAIDHFFDPHIRPPRDTNDNDDNDDGGGNDKGDSPLSPDGSYNLDFEKEAKETEREGLMTTGVGDQRE